MFFGRSFPIDYLSWSFVRSRTPRHSVYRVDGVVEDTHHFYAVEVLREDENGYLGFAIPRYPEHTNACLRSHVKIDHQSIEATYIRHALFASYYIPHAVPIV